MAKRPNRVEVNYPRGKAPQFFLVKDIFVNGKKSKVKKFLRSGQVAPSEEELEQYRREYAFDLERKAASKRAELSSSLYHSEYLTDEEISRLEELRSIFKSFTELLTINEAEAYETHFEVYYIQGTTSIEGNTLSLKEAHDLLEYGSVPDSKSLREINEVQNFKRVVQYRNKYRGKVSLEFIRTLHALIMYNIDTESAGTFRRVDDVGIVGCDLQLAPSAVIGEDLQNIIGQYYERVNSGIHPFEAAVIFHYNFEMIHPFTDGNGRVGREVFNYLLMREKFPRLLFLGKDRQIYLNALKMGNNNDYGHMVSIFCNLITNQRMDILMRNLEKVVIPAKKSRQIKRGQMILEDFQVI